MRGKFIHIAQVIRTARETHPMKYSQAELSHLLGYLNGQFVSNVERAQCSVPMKKIADISMHLNIPTQRIREAMLKDWEVAFDDAVNNRFKELSLQHKELSNDHATVNAH